MNLRNNIAWSIPGVGSSTSQKRRGALFSRHPNWRLLTGAAMVL